MEVNIGYWIAINPLNNSNDTSLLSSLEGVFGNTFKDKALVVSDCPTGYCCQNKFGCNYLNEPLSLCAKYRDPSVPLCGACLPGYSEAIGGTNCRKCDGNSIEIFLIPLIAIILFSIFLIYRKDYSENENKKDENKEDFIS